MPRSKYKPRQDLVTSIMQETETRKNITNKLQELFDLVPSFCWNSEILQNMNIEQQHTLAVMKYGIKTVTLGIRAWMSLPYGWPCGVIDKLASEVFPDIPYEVLAWTKLFTKEESVPHSRDMQLLGPPVGNCLNCYKDLTTNNKSTKVHYVTCAGEILTKYKVGLRCKICELNYLYDKFGNKKLGYRFYNEERDSVVATDGILIDRVVFNQQWAFAQHSWVSFMGFAEAWSDAHNISHENEICRKVWAEGFWWGEIEAQLRESGNVAYPFKTDSSREECMAHIDEIRKQGIYHHDKNDCTSECKARGCGKLWVTDGLWKLQFQHCMFHTKSTISGLPMVNMPDVCTNATVGRKLFCEFHIKQLKEKGHNIPAQRQELLEYIGNGNAEESHGEKVTMTAAVPKPVVSDMSGQQFLHQYPKASAEITKACEEVESRCNKDLGEGSHLRSMSRGHQFVVRGGGHIETWTPLYQSESLGQVYLFIISWLYTLLNKDAQTSAKDLWLLYDNMCQLQKMKAARNKLPLPAPYDSMFLDINKAIDSLHIANHKDPRCHQELHPSRIGDMYPEIKDTKNTQAAEQTFVWLGRYKRILVSMSKVHHLFYMHRLITRRNRYSARCYKNGKKPVLPAKK